MGLDTVKYVAGIGDWNSPRAKGRKQQRFSVSCAGRQEMSREARIDPIDAGGSLAPEPER
jgi:hypothetical protein